MLPSPKIKHHLEVLILQELLVEDSGIYVCIMNNTAGAERIEVNLTVRSWLDTLVTPSHQTIGKKSKFLLILAEYFAIFGMSYFFCRFEPTCHFYLYGNWISEAARVLDQKRTKFAVGWTSVRVLSFFFFAISNMLRWITYRCAFKCAKTRVAVV